MNIQDLGEKLGMKREVTNQILADIKANSAKLDACPRHDFSICIPRHTKQPVASPTPLQMFGAKWRCKHCGGDVDSQSKRWYELGLKHST